MIERKRRITRVMFNNTPKQRVVVGGTVLNMTYYPNNTVAACRFCVIVSKKQYKLANERNHIKRIVYEVVRINELEFDKAFGGKLIFTIKKNTPLVTFSLVKKDIELFLSDKK